MAGVLFVYEGAVARRCRCRRTRPCVFVCCVFYCCCCCFCCCSCTRGFVVWLLVVWMCKVWFSSCPGSESLPLRLQQSEFRGGQSPNHLPPIFHRHPSSGRGIFVVLRQAGQIDWTDEEQQNARKCGQKRVGADQSSENREVPVVVRPETGGRWCWPIT